MENCLHINLDLTKLFLLAFLPSFNKPFDHARRKDLKPDTSMCHMVNDNTEHHSMSTSSANDAIDACAHQHGMELKDIDSSMGLPHFSSNCDKFPVRDEVDEY